MATVFVLITLVVQFYEIYLFTVNSDIANNLAIVGMIFRRLSVFLRFTFFFGLLAAIYLHAKTVRFAIIGVITTVTNTVAQSYLINYFY